jgi:hypothetical protein
MSEELDRLNEQLEAIEEQKEFAIRGNLNYIVSFEKGAPQRGLDSRTLSQIWQELPLSRGKILNGVDQLFEFGAVYGDGSKVVSIGHYFEEVEGGPLESVGQYQDEQDEQEPEVPSIPSISHPMLDS